MYGTVPYLSVLFFKKKLHVFFLVYRNATKTTCNQDVIQGNGNHFKEK